MHDPKVAQKWADEYPGQGPKNLPMHVKKQTARKAVLSQMKGPSHG